MLIVNVTIWFNKCMWIIHFNSIVVIIFIHVMSTTFVIVLNGARRIDIPICPPPVLSHTSILIHEA